MGRSPKQFLYGIQLQNQTPATLLHEFLKPLEGSESFFALGAKTRRKRIQSLQDKGAVFNSQDMPFTNVHWTPAIPLHPAISLRHDNSLVINTTMVLKF